MDDGGDTVTFQLAADLDVHNDPIITDGTLGANDDDITALGNWTNDDPLTAASNAVTFDGTTSDNNAITSGSVSNDLIFDGSNGTWTLDIDLDLDGNLTIIADTPHVESDRAINNQRLPLFSPSSRAFTHQVCQN